MDRYEDELYRAVAGIFPGMTVRSFSHALGMSEGYWSSILSQGLQVSSKALMNLHDYLRTRSVLMECGSPRAKSLDSIQRMIAAEIVRRFALQADSVDEVWHELCSLAEEKEAELLHDYGAMPFVMLRG